MGEVIPETATNEVGRYAPDPYPALVRAAQRAREIARQTGTPLVIFQDGRIVHLDVSKELE